MPKPTEKTTIETIAANELRDHPDVLGGLASVRVLSIQELKGGLLLEVRAGGDADTHRPSRHLFRTDALQLLSLVTQIRRTLLPDFEARVLERLERIEKNL